VACLPRVLDIGQFNDACPAVQIAVGLARSFDRGVNDLPLSSIISWYERKAVAVLLTLLSLGIQNIRLGPSLPAFFSPAVLDFLSQRFNLVPIATPDEDRRAILGQSTPRRSFIPIPRQGTDVSLGTRPHDRTSFMPPEPWLRVDGVDSSVLH